MKTFQDIKEAIIHGAVKRIRHKMMTVTAMFMGLIPIISSLGTGSDMIKRIAAPMIVKVITTFILELLAYPPIYAISKWRYEMKHGTVNVSLIPGPHLRGHWVGHRIIGNRMGMAGFPYSPRQKLILEAP